MGFPAYKPNILSLISNGLHLSYIKNRALTNSDYVVDGLYQPSLTTYEMPSVNKQASEVKIS